MEAPMPAAQQLLDFDLSPETPALIPPTTHRAEFGTFKDSLRAPVHRWFTYPAGFSFKAVEEAFRMFEIRAGMTVYEPFGGTATTNIIAKQNGVHSWGIESHPFVVCVGRTKLFWEFEALQLRIDALIEGIRDAAIDCDAPRDVQIFPELVCKCYRPTKLHLLWLCREAIIEIEEAHFRDLAKLALTNLLRALADVETGWPYIAPGKPKASSPDVIGALRNQLYAMAGDLAEIRRASKTAPATRTEWMWSDSRLHHPQIPDSSADLSFTSPPYLNNYDYADRTRLETYFWGEAQTWADITQNVRKRLIMSATTQANRREFDEGDPMSAELQAIAPEIAATLKAKVQELSVLRLNKGGKKSYDIMVAGYFNDMLPILSETLRVLRKGASMVMILGDSAPYGIHVETDVMLGEIGLALGFSKYEIEDLRKRGDRWKNNPQRHSVALKESVVTLTK